MEVTTIPWNPREHLLFEDYKIHTQAKKTTLPTHSTQILSKVDPELNLSFQLPDPKDYKDKHRMDGWGVGGHQIGL